MEIKAGYKQTEVGVIPEDWHAKKLSRVAPLQRGFDLPNSQLRKGNYPVVYSNGIVNFHSEYLVKGPGVVTGRSGTIGNVHFIETNFWPHNTTLWVTSFLGNSSKYVYYLYQTIGLKSYGTGSGVPTLNRNDVHDKLIALPPTLAEQEAIANALSDVDGLIEGLQKLINKKRLMKQGAMQELLTGHKRLPGFGRDWKTHKLENLVYLSKARVDPRQLEDSEFCIELEHIEPFSGRLIGSTITNKQSSLKSVFKPGDVLFGKLRSYLRKYWQADRNGVCSTEFWVMSVNPDILTASYLFQVVKTEAFIDVASSSYGTHMPRSDWNVVKGYELPIPSKEEQEAIATTLSDMDTELEALEEKLAKYRQIKQGMMQELLTGKTRLVQLSQGS